MRPKLLCLFWLIFAMFSSSKPIIVAQAPNDLLIFAASSLSDSFTELAERFEQDNNIKVTLNFAGSSTLSAQLLQGAPADVFASANLLQMQNLIDDNLIVSDSVSIFAENELIIITPFDNPANIESAEDLANENISLVLAAPSVPIREYSNLLLASLIPIYGDGFSETVLNNLVSEESNVRQIVARIALGEADVGIVYRSDITPNLADDVQIIDLPDGVSPRTSYPIAPLIDSENASHADLFIAYVLSDAGQSILRDWGFCTPETLFSEMTPEPEATSESDEIQETDTSC